MTQVTFKGNPIKINGSMPKKGELSPDFHLAMQDLKRVSLQDFAGKKKVLNIFISVDTPVCSKSMHEFTKALKDKSDVVLLNISMDLPFAAARCCKTEGLHNVITLSGFNTSFPEDFGVKIAEGPLEGLCSRAVIVLGKDNKVLYCDLVSEITQEPNYKAVLESIE